MVGAEGAEQKVHVQWPPSARRSFSLRVRPEHFKCTPLSHTEHFRGRRSGLSLSPHTRQRPSALGAGPAPSIPDVQPTGSPALGLVASGVPLLGSLCRWGDTAACAVLGVGPGQLGSQTHGVVPILLR